MTFIKIECFETYLWPMRMTLGFVSVFSKAFSNTDMVSFTRVVADRSESSLVTEEPKNC